ncbi:hypothetical protein CYMTET_32984 [Cymbomonas tetramitiformis]|uniref:Uncharacterized protein n=1 Tax=Cymbomonas tetramitiformis TaxID=36881 RepID=A0AAE0FE11_9CHLO|nr:hypothetical protein CYMTET_32984 [Cymbomonas tetramitiformis]
MLMIVCGPGGCSRSFAPLSSVEEILAQDYSFEHVRCFCDHFTSRMEKDSTLSFEMAWYTALWEMYKRERGLTPKLRPDGSRRPSSWQRTQDVGKAKDEKAEGVHQLDKPA